MPADSASPVSAERIARNLARTRERIAAAAQTSGRDPGQITLVAVTKSVGIAETQTLLNLGLKHLGENRVQAAKPKIEALGQAVQSAGAQWHMLGHLQTNKARQALQLFHSLDALDSIHLLEELAKEARKLGRSGVPCLAEVNVSGEAQKFGLSPGTLEGFLSRAAQIPELDVRGLLTMAPYADTPSEVETISRPVFRGLRELFNQANAKGWYRQSLTELSMGMSGDFEIAVEEGATVVRIGTGLFT